VGLLVFSPDHEAHVLTRVIENSRSVMVVMVTRGIWIHLRRGIIIQIDSEPLHNISQLTSTQVVFHSMKLNVETVEIWVNTEHSLLMNRECCLIT
jgi:hypothetical protein